MEAGHNATQNDSYRHDAQSRIDELNGEQGIVLVGEDGLAPHRAGVLIDLVVDGEQRAGGELRRQIAGIEFDHQFRIGLLGLFWMASGRSRWSDCHTCLLGLLWKGLF